MANENYPPDDPLFDGFDNSEVNQVANDNSRNGYLRKEPKDRDSIHIGSDEPESGSGGNFTHDTAKSSSAHIDDSGNKERNHTRSTSGQSGAAVGHGILGGLACIGMACVALGRGCGQVARVATHLDDFAHIGSHADDLAHIGSHTDDFGRLGSHVDDFARIGSGFGDNGSDLDRLHRSLTELNSVVKKPIKIGDTFLDTATRFYKNLDDGPWTLLDGEEIATRPLAVSDNLTIPAIVEEPKVLALIPDSETAFKNVFGEFPSISAIDEMKRVKRLFNALSRANCLSEDTFGSRQLLSLIQQDDASNTIVIVAHSEEGSDSARAIRLLNGESISVDELHRVAIDSRKQCLILTCHGDDFAIPGKVSMMDAYQMAQKGMRICNLRGYSMPTDDFIRVIRKERSVIKARRVIIVGTMSTVGGASVHIVVSKLADAPKTHDTQKTAPEVPAQSVEEKSDVQVD